MERIGDDRDDPADGDYGPATEPIQEPPGHGAGDQHAYAHQSGDEPDLCGRTAGLLQIDRRSRNSAVVVLNRNATPLVRRRAARREGTFSSGMDGFLPVRIGRGAPPRRERQGGCDRIAMCVTPSACPFPDLDAEKLLVHLHQGVGVLAPQAAALAMSSTLSRLFVIGSGTFNSRPRLLM